MSLKSRLESNKEEEGFSSAMRWTRHSGICDRYSSQFKNNMPTRTNTYTHTHIHTRESSACPLCRNVKRLRGGLVFKACRPLYHSNLGSRVMEEKRNLRLEPRFNLRGGTRGPSKPDSVALQGYLAHKKQQPPLGPPQGPRYSLTVGSLGGAVSYERGTRLGGAPGIRKSAGRGLVSPPVYQPSQSASK